MEHFFSFAILTFLLITHLPAIYTAAKPFNPVLRNDEGRVSTGKPGNTSVPGDDHLQSFGPRLSSSAVTDSSGAFPDQLITGVSHCTSSLVLMVQSILNEQEVLLDYFPGDTVIYIGAITRDEAGIYLCHTGSFFWDSLQYNIRMMKHADLRNFSGKNDRLSRILLDPVRHLLNGKSRLIIIPHQALSGFPFETLWSPSSEQNAQDGRGRKYLIENFQIVYNFSVAGWISLRRAKMICNSPAEEHKSFSFVGFSPGFGSHDCIQPLQNSIKELDLIGRLFQDKGLSSVVLENESSNEHNFRKVAGNSFILHLATHTFTDEQYPEMNGLLFWEFGTSEEPGDGEDGLLKINEICNLQIPAELIVLNSCSSATVKSRVGTCWYSPAECFLLAGARNILCTLWNITDRSACEFIIEFYRLYLHGMSFSEALQKVKIRMVRKPSTSLAINWATYILIGE